MSAKLRKNERRTKEFILFSSECQKLRQSQSYEKTREEQKNSFLELKKFIKKSFLYSKVRIFATKILTNHRFNCMKAKKFLLLLLSAATLLGCGGKQQRSQENTDEIAENEVRQPLDFSSVWMAYQDNILGYVGENYERFYLLIDSIKVDTEDTLLYHVWGRYRIKYNMYSYEGKICVHKNIATLPKKYQVDEEVLPENGTQVYSIASEWNLKAINANEQIKGEMTSTFFIRDGMAVFDDIELGSDPYCNNQFIGTWTSQEFGEQKCRWGTFRIPDSEDLDIGAAEFSPATEYLANGWWSYNEAILEGTEEGWEREELSRWFRKDDSQPYIPVQVRPFVRATENAPITEKNLLAGFKFGMNEKEYDVAFDKLQRIECDQIKLVVNDIYFQASAGMPLFSHGELYYKSFFLNYKGVRGADLTKADFASLADYFKGIYGADSLHYMYTEMPISEFPTHHWRKGNLYFCLTWIPEDEVWNIIALEYMNGPAYWNEVKAKSKKE